MPFAFIFSWWSGTPSHQCSTAYSCSSYFQSNIHPPFDSSHKKACLPWTYQPTPNVLQTFSAPLIYKTSCSTSVQRTAYLSCRAIAACPQTSYTSNAYPTIQRKQNWTMNSIPSVNEQIMRIDLLNHDQPYGAFTYDVKTATSVFPNSLYWKMRSDCNLTRTSFWYFGETSMEAIDE